MTARDPDPVQPQVCPRCKGPVREATRIEFVAGKPNYCEPCDLFSTGSASEFDRYRSLEILAEAERMATAPHREDER